MQIGGKEYKVGQRIKVIKAGETAGGQEIVNGLTGTIIKESNYCKDAVAVLKLDEPHDKKFTKGTTRLFCDDEIELLEEDMKRE